MREKLQSAFDYADAYVLENTDCPTIANISNGWCGVWAQAVKRAAQFVEVREYLGHWYVVADGIAYDSDTSEGGFSPP